MKDDVITIDLMTRIAAAEKRLGVTLSDEQAVAIVEDEGDTLYEMALEGVDLTLSDLVQKYADRPDGYTR